MYIVTITYTDNYELTMSFYTLDDAQWFVYNEGDHVRDWDWEYIPEDD